MSSAERYRKVPIAEITSAQKFGPLMVYKDRWWAVSEDGCVFIYTHRGSNSPQCNANKSIVERIFDLPEPTKAVLLPWAYLPFKISDYT